MDTDILFTKGLGSMLKTEALQAQETCGDCDSAWVDLFQTNTLDIQNNFRRMI